MKWTNIAKQATEQAKKAFEDRGGTEGLKRDAEQLREIAQGQGSAKEKAQRAADALKKRPAETPDGEQRPPAGS
jgi:hypothetical protein